MSPRRSNSRRHWKDDNPVARSAQGASDRAEKLNKLGITKPKDKDNYLWGVASQGNRTITTATTWNPPELLGLSSTVQSCIQVRLIGGPPAYWDSCLHMLATDEGNLPAMCYETEDGVYVYRARDAANLPVYEWVPKLKPEITEFYAEPIMGWREWKLVPPIPRLSEYRLESISSNTVWPPYELLQASCNHSLAIQCGSSVYAPHATPNWDCTCGIYAYKDKTALRRGIGFTIPCLYGTVALEGDEVIVTEYGYRAQAAYPKHLILSDRYDSDVSIRRYVARKVSDTYGVPCELESHGNHE